VISSAKNLGDSISLTPFGIISTRGFVRIAE
jgi:hypothetical protein